MATGHALLVTALALAVVTTLVAGAVPWASARSWSWYPAGPTVVRIGSWVVLGLTAAATLQLLALLVAGDHSVHYVWQHSATSEPVMRRMSALLAGQEGSLLVWSVGAAAVSAWAAQRWSRARDGDRADAMTVHRVVSVVTSVVLALTVAAAPFRSFAAAFPGLETTTAPVDGRGLNPVLANPWMPPHTLLTFASYALIGLAFAIATLELVRTAQGHIAVARRWWQPALRVTRWAWLSLTAGLVTGLVWAYEEMSFGWFWSWDPVEAATLSVWLLLTAALHARAEPGNGRRQLVHAPVLTGATFVAVIFATFVTRSGLHPSVHAFASGSLGPALGVLLTGLVLGFLVLVIAATRAVPSVAARRPWVSWAAWILVAGSGLITWGLAYPMGAAGIADRAVDLDTGFFTVWGYLIALALLVGMGYGLQRASGHRRDAVVSLGLFLGLTLLAAIVKPVAGLELIGAERRAIVGPLESTLGRASMLTLLAPASYALLAIGERWWATRGIGSARARRANTGSALLHLGAVAAIVGVTFATLLSSSTTIPVDPATGSGTAGGLQVSIVDLERSERTDAVGRIIEERETVTVEVRSATRVLAAGEAALATYPERDMGRHPTVLIDRGLLADTQVIYHGLAELGPAGVPVTVRRIPLMGLVWAGFGLLAAGGLLTTTAHAPRRRPPRGGDRPPAHLVEPGHGASR